MSDRARLAADALQRAGERTAEADRTVRRLLAPHRHLARGLVVMATGGYARGDLAPRSDLDLLILVRDPDSHPNVIRELVHGLWNLNLKPAQTVLSMGDLDPRLFTIPDRASSLLEVRQIWGDSALAWDFEAEVNRLLDSSVWEEYVRQKRLEFQARRDKFGDVARVVEPHLKNEAGGFRDLHHVLWLERAWDAYRDRWRLRRRRGNMIQAFTGRLRRDHLLTPWEADQLLEAYGFLLAVRETLHRRRRRDEDRLLVTEQAAVAEDLGYAGPDRTRMRELMRDVYWSGEKFSRFCDEFGHRFSTADGETQEHPVVRDRLRGVLVEHDRLNIAPAALRRLATHPAELIDLVEVSVSERLPLAGRSRHSLRRALHHETGPQHRPAGWAEPLAAWFASESGFATRLRRLDELDAISLWLPEWSEIAGLTTGSYYHRYTVDEHTLRALEVLDSLPSHGLEGGPHAVWAHCDHRPLVYLAIIFHDIAKGRPGEHSLEGANIAQTALPRFGMDRWAADVAKLVRLHLRMEQVAFRRDFTDPATLSTFVAEVGERHILNALYLLTVCDLSAVRSGVWSAWKGRLLSELYVKARDLLEEGFDTVYDTPAEEARKIAPHLEGSDEEERSRAREFIGTLEEEYWRNVPSSEIARHMDAVDDLLEGRADHHWLIDREPGYVIITLIDRDRSGLLADIAGLLTSQGIGIREARIFTREDGVIIDRFRAEDVEPTEVPLAERLRQIPQLWAQLSDGSITLDNLFQRFRRRSRLETRKEALVETEISIRPVPDGALVDVSGPDRIGLLHRLCTVFAEEGYDLRSARVTGRIDGIIDSFLIDDPQRRLISADEQQALRNRLHDAAGVG